MRQSQTPGWKGKHYAFSKTWRVSTFPATEQNNPNSSTACFATALCIFWMENAAVIS